MTTTLSLAQATTQSHTGSVMDDDDDDSAPLLPHEITSNTPPPTQTPQIKRLSLISHHGNALASPAAPPTHHRPQSPLEPFPAFDPTIGPPPSPPRRRPTTPTHSAPLAPPRLPPEKRATIVRDPRPQQQPPAPHLSRDDFLPSMLRCHTLFSLAARLPPAQARPHLREAAGLLAALERAPAAGPQMIELSTGSLRERLRALERRVAAREGREAAERELCEGTARVTAWLEGL